MLHIVDALSRAAKIKRKLEEERCLHHHILFSIFFRAFYDPAVQEIFLLALSTY
jgi:hypothetical protein